MADDNTGAPWYDPAQTLTPDDPLRAWADQNIDWKTSRLLQQDPQKAIDDLVKRGVPPPDVHADGSRALPFADPYGNEVDPNSGMPAITPRAAPPPPPYRLDPKATQAWRDESDRLQGNPAALGKPTVPLSPKVIPPQIASASPLDPEENPSPVAPGKVPLPLERPTDTDVSAKKKPSVADAVGDASKSFAGIKAPTAPPLNPVGTPSVRSPGAITAPNLANLIALTQGQAPGPIQQALGKLLVQGKA